MSVEMHICHHDVWMSSFAPFSPSRDHLEACIAHLEQEGVLVRHAEDGYYTWRDFPRAPNKLRTAKEDPKVASSVESPTSAADILPVPGATVTNSDDVAPEARGDVLDAEVLEVDDAGFFSPMDVDEAAKPDKKKLHTEPQIFSKLRAISDSIGRYTYGDPVNPANNRKATCQYGEQPNLTFAMEKDGGSHKVDGFQELKDAMSNVEQDVRRHDADIPCNNFYKLETTPSDIQDNRLQAVGAAVATMNNDPIRTHTYSLTFENASVSAWYWSRSCSVRSKPFNFASEKVPKDDICRFVATLMSFVFGRTDELGYDPCMHRRRDPESQQIYYVFEMNGCFYRSVDILFESENLRISSRATRVWKVIEINSLTDTNVKPGAVHKVLKDAWVPEGQRFEREIQEAIFKDLQALVDSYALPSDASLEDLCGERQMDRERFYRDPPKALNGAPKDVLALVFDSLSRYREFFAVISNDRKGGPKSRLLPPKPAVRIEPDVFTIPPPQRNGPKKMPGSRPSCHTLPASLGTGSATSRAPSASPNVPQREFRVKTRYWILLDDVGVALRNLEDLAKVFIVAKDGLIALWLLSLVEWIHRDISDGNILMFETTKDGKTSVGGKLADLEFAIKPSTSRQTATDPKTGTPFFMAVEIHSGARLFLPIAKKEDRPRINFNLKTVLDVQDSGSGKVGIAHSVYHDIESFFWLALYFLTVRVAHQPSFEWAKTIFVSSPFCPAAKKDLFSDPDMNFRTTFEAYCHPSFHRLRPFIDALRHELLAIYHPEAERVSDWEIFATAELLLKETRKACSTPGAPILAVWQPESTRGSTLPEPPLGEILSTGTSGSQKRKSTAGAAHSIVPKVHRSKRREDVSSKRSSVSDPTVVHPNDLATSAAPTPSEVPDPHRSESQPQPVATTPFNMPGRVARMKTKAQSMARTKSAKN